MAAASGQLTVDKGDGKRLLVILSGVWTRLASRAEMEGLDAALREVAAGGEVEFRAERLGEWDSRLLAFLLQAVRTCRERGLVVRLEVMPEGVERLLGLATAVPVVDDLRRSSPPASWLHRLGENCLAGVAAGRDLLAFVGEVTTALGRLARGRAQMPWRELLAVVQDTGPQALPIITLIAALMGIILAFVGAVQLRLVGAEIFVADLVAIGIVRSLGAVMAGIVMAGRTGASFAARLGAMQVNEEIDAFQTLGIRPVDYLVLPRLLGLLLTMPLLCLYANVVGVMGGMLVGVSMLGLPARLYYRQTIEAVALNDLSVGLAMSVVFGGLVAFFGCLRGLRCGRSATAVGTATTSAVVSGIVGVVVGTAVITIIADILGV